MRKRWRLAGLTLVLAMTAGACGLASSETNERCLVYSGGSFEEKKFIKVLPPGATSESVGVGSSTYCYRTDQRSYIGSDEQGKGDTGPALVVSRDGVRMLAGFQLYFKQNHDMDGDNGPFRQFHENLGVKVKGQTVNGDTIDGAWTLKGWIQLLREYFEPQIERALESAALLQDWRPLYSSEEARARFNDDTVRILKDNIRQVIGGNYFCGPTYNGPGTPCGDFTFTVGKPRPENPDILNAIEAEQTARARLANQETENARIRAQVEGERAQVTLYGADNAVLLEAIRSGKVETFVIDAADGTTTPAR